MIGAAVGFFAAAAFIPGAGFLVGSLLVDEMVAGIGLAGIGMEAGAVADALTSNRGESITIRQPAAPRQYVYGTQRIGGNLIFASTTGSEKDQLNRVFVLADHELWAIQNIYLDGRQVYFAGSGQGWQVVNGYGFGGGGDGNSHVGPDGSQYTFDNATSGHSGVYIEARYGTQSTSDYMGSLTGNDSRWGPDSSGAVPCCAGMAYIYLKCEADANLFPSEPEIRVTVKGKPVYDPRTGVTAYSENPALIIADYLTDSVFGIGDAVNQEQLIAAANICDELVTYYGGGGGQEARYTCHYHFDSATAPADVLTEMLKSMGGRMSYIGGEWYLYPATYLGPTLTLDESSLIDKPTWKPTKQYRTLCNRVQGSYTAPNYPYSAATAPGSLSDLYDSNGFYNGNIEDTFPFAFQPSSYPTYAQDTLHGYASDTWLTADGGVELFQTLDLPAVLSVSQAQRLAKISLLRNRQQGSGTFIMSPVGYQLQCCDTFNFIFPQRGWTGELLEVTGVHFLVDKDASGLPLVKVAVDAQQTDPSVYEWDESDELTPYDVPAAPANYGIFATAPPTDVVLVSSAATALLQPDGTVIPRIQITWVSPADTRVTAIQSQYQLAGASNWSDGGTASVASNLMYIAPVVAGAVYNVQVRSLRANGAASAWVTIDSFTASLVLSVSAENAIGQGSLIGVANSDGTAAIECTTFSAYLGGQSITYFPTPQTISGLAQQTLYWVYVIDPTVSGGNLTPIATTTQYSGVGQIGYFLIGSIVTPYASSSGGSSSTIYEPSAYSDTGTRTTQNPTAAYDGNLSSYATVSGALVSIWLAAPEPGKATTTTSAGYCTWSGFVGITGAVVTLSILVEETSDTDGGATAGETNVVVNIGSTAQPLTSTVNGSQTTYSCSIPSGTDMSTVSVVVTAIPGTGRATSTNTDVASSVSVQVYEISAE